MLDIFAPYQRKILLQYGFVRELEQGKKISKKVFDENLEAFREEMIKKGLKPHELSVLARYAEGWAIYTTKDKIRLDYNKYGFPDNMNCRIEPTAPKFSKDVKFNPASISKLKDIYELKEAPLNWLLESVAKIVNDSMEYDYKRAANKEKNLDWEKIKKTYPTTGKETMSGVCSDAGIIIRCILKSLSFEKNINFQHIAAQADAAHDITLVYNTSTENWALVNSKRGPNDYYLIPKDELARFGPLWPCSGEDETSPYYLK